MTHVWDLSASTPSNPLQFALGSTRTVWVGWKYLYQINFDPTRN